jgi:hypothetical protein
VTDPTTGHLDLDTLADVLAGVAPEAAEHLMECAHCRAELDELRGASTRTTAALAALPALTVPADIAERLTSALRSEGRPSGDATVTTLPAAARGPAPRGHTRWLGAAAAVAVLLAGAGYGVSRLGDGGSATSTSAAGSADKAAGVPGLHLVRNSTGNDYTGRDTLAAAVPGLLAGARVAADLSAPTAPAGHAAPNAAGTKPQTQLALDPLARLRTDTGLADCLLALLPPDDPSVRPLALDYAQYKGKPALVVVLPGGVKGKLDVFVVGPGCSRANDSTLFYTSVDRP